MNSELALKLLDQNPGGLTQDRIEEALSELNAYCEDFNLSPEKLFQMSAAEDQETFAEQWIHWCANYNTDDTPPGEPYFSFEDYLVQDRDLDDDIEW